MIYRFNGYALDTGLYQLNMGDDPVPVEPQVFDLLVYLIQNRERVVTRDELLEKLWPGKVVTDAALSARLKASRKAVGDTGRDQLKIKTIHRRGRVAPGGAERPCGIREFEVQAHPGRHPGIEVVTIPRSNEYVRSGQVLIDL